MTDPDAGSGGRRTRSGDRAALDTALGWAAGEGWRPGRHDATAFAVVDPAGLMSTRVDDRVVSTLTAVRYSDDFGFVGLFITDPAERGRGHGQAVWAAGTEHLAGVTSVGLDGVVERESLYAALGYRRAHLSRRWAMPAEAPSPRDGSVADAADPDAATPGRTVDARDLGASALAEYEVRARAFPVRREAFVAAWLELPESHARAVVAADGTVRGYGVVRRCSAGAKIAPLFADDPVTAASLLDTLLDLGSPWGEVSIDVPDPNEAGLALVQARGMRPEFACVRMYAGTAPGLDLRRVFGLTSFELG